MKKIRTAAAILTAALLCGCNTYDPMDVTPDTTASVTESTPAAATPAPKTDGTPAESSDGTPAPESNTEETTPPQTNQTTTVPPIAVSTTTKAPATKPPATDPPATTVKQDSKINSYRKIGGSGILVAGINNHYWGIMFFGGTYGYCDMYVNSVKQFQAALPEVNVCSMVIPTSVDFYNPEDYRGYSELQKDKIEYIEDKLENTGVTNIKVYDVLSRHTDEPIYARTDHHWMPLGAYYAAQKFCNDLKLPISKLDKYKAVTCPGYVGSMYYYSEDEKLTTDPEDYTVYYSPNADKLETTYYDVYYSNGYDSNLFIVDDASSYYLTFLGGDDKMTHVKTNVKNGRNLVVIKESYGNALIPFLTEAFENIYVIDLRYCEINAVNFCKKVKATDLLFANCAYTTAGGNCEYFDYIRTL